MKRMLVWGIALAMMFCCAASAWADHSYEGTVVAGEVRPISAGFGGKVGGITLKVGDEVAEGQPLATIQSTLNFAPVEGTVTGLYAAEGDDVESVISRYGALLYLEPTNRYLIKATTDKAYNASENHYIHLGERVYLTCTPDLVRVTLPVLAQKEVPLTVVLQDAPDANTENTRITIEPKTLKLAGDSATLENINQIQLDIIDLSKIGTEYTAKYTIPIPVGVRNRSGITEATVTIEILGVETKSLEIDHFEWLGVSDDVEVIVETEKLPVLLRGASKYMNTLNAGAVYAEADLSNLMGSLGNHFVTVQIRIPGNSRVGAIQIDGLPDYTVAIQLKQKEAHS